VQCSAARHAVNKAALCYNNIQSACLLRRCSRPRPRTSVPPSRRTINAPPGLNSHAERYANQISARPIPAASVQSRRPSTPNAPSPSLISRTRGTAVLLGVLWFPAAGAQKHVMLSFTLLLRRSSDLIHANTFEQAKVKRTSMSFPNWRV
jgi:hypothetical protein